MKLQHTTPCKQCPWRKASAQGFLGGNSPEQYADMVAANQVPNCHMTEGKGKRPAFCAGSLATMANSCITPRYPEGASHLDSKAVGQRADCFRWVKDFYAYHTRGLEYVHRLLRKA